MKQKDFAAESRDELRRRRLRGIARWACFGVLLALGFLALNSALFNAWLSGGPPRAMAKSHYVDRYHWYLAISLSCFGAAALMLFLLRRRRR